MLANKVSTRSVARSAVLPARVSRASRVVTKASLDTAVVVGGATISMLAVGRLAFLPFQRRSIAKADTVGPKTTGTTYFDSLQQTSSFTVTTNDPAGFTIVDVLGWGALGHALGFALLACGSNGYFPNFQ